MRPVQLDMERVEIAFFNSSLVSIIEGTKRGAVPVDLLKQCITLALTQVVCIGLVEQIGIWCV